MREATHVVVVDDHNEIREQVQKHLEQQGYKVSLAEAEPPYGAFSTDTSST